MRQKHLCHNLWIQPLSLKWLWIKVKGASFVITIPSSHTPVLESPRGLLPGEPGNKAYWNTQPQQFVKMFLTGMFLMALLQVSRPRLWLRTYLFPDAGVAICPANSVLWWVQEKPVLFNLSSFLLEGQEWLLPNSVCARAKTTDLFWWIFFSVRGYWRVFDRRAFDLKVHREHFPR